MPTAYMHANEFGDAAAGLELVASLDMMSVGEGGNCCHFGGGAVFREVGLRSVRQQLHLDKVQKVA